VEIKEPSIAYRKKKFSEEEYLQMERAGTEKHEYYKGDVFQIATLNSINPFKLHNKAGLLLNSNRSTCGDVAI
jgi:hypothetical protein